MSPDARSRHITAIFEAAYELPAADRAAFLAVACGADESLRREVESLLAAEARAGAFLEDAGPTIAETLAPQAAPLTPGERIGTFLIEGEIGRGGMGVVYRAQDERLNRKVAVKALSPLIDRPGDEARQRLRREAQAAAALSHECVATVYALEERGGDWFIVSELVEGQTLRDRLQYGPVPVREAVEIALQVARGVAAAHALGIVHRDLKPDNVILTPTGGVKILDFGIAHIGQTTSDSTTRTLTAAGLIVGTPGYMAPEQLRDGPVDPRTDVFALGVLLYELLTGDAPFGRGGGPSVVLAVIEREPEPIGARVAGVPPAVAQIVATCLAKMPGARYASASEVAAALDAARLSMIGVATPQPIGIASRPPTRDPIWWWRFHLAAATVAHSAMVVPAAWFIGAIPGRAGRVLFLAILVTAAITGILRLHLRFTTIEGPVEGARELARRGPWIRRGDRLFALLLGSGGLLVADSSPGLAAVCLACAAGTIVAAEVIETRTAARATGTRP
jgi:predicted Ser/Thr protein kinase